jgi:cytochrome c553
MNVSRSLTRLFIAVLAFAVLAPLQAQDQEQYSPSLPGSDGGKVEEKHMAYLVQLCETCHGESGRSERPDVPALAGRDADALFAEIERFYFYERVCPDVPVDGEEPSKGHMSMCDVVNQMSKQEALALARHFSSQAPAP